MKEKGGKILFIWGPKRSDKTTLLEKLSKKLKCQIFNFDFTDDSKKFLPDRIHLEKIAKENKIILIDEVQNSPESSRALKILVDVYKKTNYSNWLKRIAAKGRERF